MICSDVKGGADRGAKDDLELERLGEYLVLSLDLLDFEQSYSFVA